MDTLTPVNPVVMFRQDIDGGLRSIFIIKFYPKGTLCQLSVVIDSDVLDTNLLLGQKNGKCGDGARFVGNVYRQYIFCLDGAVGTVGKGIPVGTCGIKEQIECIFVLPVKIGGQHSQILYVGL